MHRMTDIIECLRAHYGAAAIIQDYTGDGRLYWRRRPLALSRMYVQGQPRRVLRIGVWLIVRQVPCRVSKSKDLQLGARGGAGG